VNGDSGNNEFGSLPTFECAPITPPDPPHWSSFQDINSEDGPPAAPDLDLGAFAGNSLQKRQLVTIQPEETVGGLGCAG